MPANLTRRDWSHKTASVVSGAFLAAPSLGRAAAAPASPVAVAVKINLTGAPSYRLGYLPLEDTHYTHPRVIAAAVHLMGKAGARQRCRIRFRRHPQAAASFKGLI